MTLKLSDSAIIDLLGGTTKVAKLVGVSPNAVSMWRKNNIPASQFAFSWGYFRARISWTYQQKRFISTILALNLARVVKKQCFWGAR